LWRILPYIQTPIIEFIGIPFVCNHIPIPFPKANIVFDDELRTPRFAWAKALAKAGGARFGKENS